MPAGDAAITKAAKKPRIAKSNNATAKGGSSAELAAARARQLSEFTPESPGEVLVRLVREAVFARIRHRALLKVLASGPFDARTYRETFREYVRRDYRALYARLILTDGDFRTLHDQWVEDDEQYYKGFFSGELETLEHDG